MKNKASKNTLSVLTIKGKYNNAVCFCEDLDEFAADQIRAVCDQEDFAESRIRIMPDVHAGMGCTIGTTMTIHDKIVPGMVGVDIGCGMETVEIEERTIDFKKLDDIIRLQIPSGRNIRKKYHPLNDEINLDKLKCADSVDMDRARLSIGTLGGGNHFIEVGQGDNDRLFIVVHSGSRHIGKEVAEYYQMKAQSQIKKSGKSDALPKDLSYVSGDLFNDYIHDMKLIQRFASLNRKAIMDTLLDILSLSKIDEFTTIHNYIDTEEMILRKGAVSAKKGEKLLIPLNMRDGSLICMGKGNRDWNCSAPHGAGRIMSRRAAFKSLSMDEYKRQMKGIYTTCITSDTLDEAPMAYKNMGSIVRQIVSTAEILMQIRPVYNFKSRE
ncbi:MAG: RtcB family protein [Anaerovoracaceae bacterium]